MRALSTAGNAEFERVRFVLTDMDETLTYQGRLSAATYSSLERLQAAGVRVIPVTAAPAGWCDQMARMWPVDGVIGENGGVFFQRKPNGHGVARKFWHADNVLGATFAKLASVASAVQATVPEAKLADDQAFRLTSIAFSQPTDPAIGEQIVKVLESGGANTTINNLWILGWLGEYDKLAMSRRVLADVYGVDIDTEREAVLYTGDSTNDAPMFGFFEHTVGVSTVQRYLSQIPTPPAWITAGPGGDGFVEAVEAVIASRSQSSSKSRDDPVR